MSKKSIRRRIHAADNGLSHQTLRRSPRFSSSETMDGSPSSRQHMDDEESAECHVVHLSKVSTQSTSRSNLIISSRQTPLRRSARFLQPEKLKPENSSQLSTLSKKSVKTHPGFSSISSQSKQKASYKLCRQGIHVRSQPKHLRSNFGGVLEEAQNVCRQSPRSTSENRVKAVESRQQFPQGNARRWSSRLVGLDSVYERVKQGNQNPKTSDEVDYEKFRQVDCKAVNSQILRCSTRVISGKGCNEPEAVIKPIPKKMPKKVCESMTSQIRRSSRRLAATSNGVMKRGITLNVPEKEEEVEERLGADRGDLLLERRLGDGFLIRKTAELDKQKRRKMEEGNGAENRIEKIKKEDRHVTVGWTNEQEEALHNAYLKAKPSPHFWKKVSRMVPGKSAQDCFDKIHASVVTPLSSQPRSKTSTVGFSPVANFSLSGMISPQALELEAGRLRKTRTKKLAAHKTVRHLLRKHSAIDRSKAIDRFALLESSTTNISSPAILRSPETFLPPPDPKSSSNLKMLSRFKLLDSPTGPSPEVLKKIKNRALHDRYIDQLHHREARRAMLAKKSNAGGVGGQPEHGGLKEARCALISDAVSFIKHFRDSRANPVHELEEGEDDDCYGDDQDVDGDDVDE